MDRWSEQTLKKVVGESRSKSQVLRKLGLKTFAGNFNTLGRYLAKFSISTSHFDRKPTCSRAPTNKIDIDQILVADSTYASSSNLKKRLLTEGLLNNKCAVCDADPVWMKKPLVMVLDHINGVNNDNRIANLRLLCPNCNSQQKTFAGRNVADKSEHLCISCGKKLGAKRKTEKCSRCYWNERVPSSKVNRQCAECKTPISDEATRCPKCHSISQRKVDRPTSAQLAQDIQSMTWVAMGKKYGVSDNAVRKWARQYGLIT